MASNSLEKRLLLRVLSENDGLRGGNNGKNLVSQIFADATSEKSILKVSSNSIKMNLFHSLLLNQFLVSSIQIFAFISIGASKYIHHKARLLLSLRSHVDASKKWNKRGVFHNPVVEVIHNGVNRRMATKLLK